MAYSDIQDKLGQIKMTNINQIYSQIPHVKGDLIAQGMSDEEKFKKKKELKKQVRKTPKQRQSSARAKDPKFQGGSPGTVFVPEEFVPDPTAEEIQEALQDEDMREGNFLQDPESINRILQIGGEALKFIPRLLINPMNQMAQLPHSPPLELLPNKDDKGKFLHSPLRFKTDQERIKFMDDFSRAYGRYS